MIHDIGVIEDIKYHPELGSKYVEKVLEEIGLTSQELEKNNIKINLQDLIRDIKSNCKISYINNKSINRR